MLHSLAGPVVTYTPACAKANKASPVGDVAAQRTRPALSGAMETKGAVTACCREGGLAYLSNLHASSGRGGGVHTSRPSSPYVWLHPAALRSDGVLAASTSAKLRCAAPVEVLHDACGGGRVVMGRIFALPAPAAHTATCNESGAAASAGLTVAKRETQSSPCTGDPEACRAW